MSEAQVEVQAAEPQPQVEEEVFDVRDFPAGLRGALEAVLMVVEEPIDESTLAAALDVPLDQVRKQLVDLAREIGRAHV